MRVLFAPDYTKDNPYQRLLADALKAEAIEVSLLNFYKRGMPLSRAISRVCPDVLHLHWPEAYFSQKNDSLDFMRKLRYPLDLNLSKRICPVVYTAHNLTPHNSRCKSIRRNMQATLKTAEGIIVHSEACRDVLADQYRVSPSQCWVIPHGDLSVILEPPVSRSAARERLNLDDTPICLMFGVISRYKGIDEVIQWWLHARPEGQLVIAGPVFDSDYGEELERVISGAPGITLKQGRLSDEELTLWLCASDCALFNYKQIFTSGAACLARSFGLPVLLPARLTTVDLDEPSSLVIRFDKFDELSEKMDLLSQRASGWDAAADWRLKTSWESVAKATARVYRTCSNRV